MPAIVTRKIHVVDASRKPVGRLASNIALILQGKNKAVYAPNRDCGDTVIVKNIRRAIFTGRKIGQKKYFHYSGYPGGIREDLLRDLWSQNPSSVFVRVVKQMLPDNTLRKKWLGRLKFEAENSKVK